ncbi:MAG: hypothetical protein L0241_06625 [Planctomycetia bacterium]|nr:hypothetical protein [Planctomycetia bacterium]
MFRSLALLTACFILVGVAKADEPQRIAPGQQHENVLPANPKRWRGNIDPKKLRELAEGGSSDWLSKDRRKTLDELMKEVPPKYHPMIKEYFEKLKKMQKDKK